MNSQINKVPRRCVCYYLLPCFTMYIFMQLPDFIFYILLFFSYYFT